MVWSKEREAFSNYVVRKRDCIRSTLCYFLWGFFVRLDGQRGNMATCCQMAYHHFVGI